MSDRDCQEVFRLLSEYLDQELPADTCAEMARHIADCPPCVAFVESLRKSIGICKSYAGPEKPEPLSAEARDALKAAYDKMLARRRA